MKCLHNQEFLHVPLSMAYCGYHACTTGKPQLREGQARDLRNNTASPPWPYLYMGLFLGRSAGGDDLQNNTAAPPTPEPQQELNAACPLQPQVERHVHAQTHSHMHKHIITSKPGILTDHPQSDLAIIPPKEANLLGFKHLSACHSFAKIISSPSYTMQCKTRKITTSRKY